MIYATMVNYNGKIYPAGSDVPVKTKKVEVKEDVVIDEVDNTATSNKRRKKVEE